MREAYRPVPSQDGGAVSLRSLSITPPMSFKQWQTACANGRKHEPDTPEELFLLSVIRHRGIEIPPQGTYDSVRPTSCASYLHAARLPRSARAASVIDTSSSPSDVTPAGVIERNAPGRLERHSPETAQLPEMLRRALQTQPRVRRTRKALS